MIKTDRQQTVNELKEYAETVGENAVNYVEALKMYLDGFIDRGQKISSQDQLTDADLWGYGTQADLITQKAKDLGIWECPELWA